MIGYSGCEVTGEIRIKSASGVQVYKVLAVGRLDVKHDFIQFEGWDGQRQYVDAGRSRVTFNDVILDIPVVLSDADWKDVGAIVQAAGTKPSATQQYDEHVATCRQCYEVDHIPQRYIWKRRCATGKTLVLAACKEGRQRRAVVPRFDARRHKDMYGVPYTAESFASGIASAFYDGEEQRAAYAARVDECASDYSW
jgi:hypothetical protein